MQSGVTLWIPVPRVGYHQVIKEGTEGEFQNQAFALCPCRQMRTSHLARGVTIEYMRKVVVCGNLAAIALAQHSTVQTGKHQLYGRLI